MDPDYLLLLQHFASAAPLVLCSCHNLCVSPSWIINWFSMYVTVCVCVCVCAESVWTWRVCVCVCVCDINLSQRGLTFSYKIRLCATTPHMSLWLCVQEGTVTGMAAILCPPLLWPVKRQQGILGPLTLCLQTGNMTAHSEVTNSRFCHLFTSLIFTFRLKRAFIHKSVTALFCWKCLWFKWEVVPV